MPPKRVASAASKAASAATSKPPATRGARKAAAPATQAAAPAPRVTRSRAVAAATAPAPAVDNPEPRKRRRAAANEDASTDQTEAPAPAGKAATKSAPKRRRLAEKHGDSHDPHNVKESDQIDQAAADQQVLADRTDPVSPAGNDAALSSQQQNRLSGSDDLPALVESGQTNVEAVAGNNDRTDAAHPDGSGVPSLLEPTPQTADADDLPAAHANDQGDAQAATTASDLPGDRRLDTLWPELIASIFEHLPSLRDLSAVAPLRNEFHQISNPMLYRRLIGLFDAPAALRLCVTMVKRRAFSFHTRVFDGQHIAAQLPRQHLNAITGALQTTCNLEALTLPPITDRVLSDCVHRRLQVLRVLGPDPPLAYIARHPWLKALEFHPASINWLSDPARIGPGVPLAFVRCCMAVAAQLMPPRPPPPPVDEDGKPLPDEDGSPLPDEDGSPLPDDDSTPPPPPPPRTLASDSVLEVHPSTTVMAQAKYDARQFLKALAETHRAPGTLVLDRLALEDVAELISKDKDPPVVLTVSRIRLCMKVSNMTAVMRNLEFISAILMCFKGLTTLELRDEVTPVAAQVHESVWLDDNQLCHWKKTRPTLTRIVSPQKRAYAYKYPIWTQVEDAEDQPSPFQLYGL